MMVKTLEIYACDICGKRHDDRAAAEKCEARGIIDFEAAPEVGDIVLCGAQGWWEGDPAWREIVPGETYLSHGNMPMISSRWVVIETGMDEHLRRYVLWTPSNREGKPMVATTSRWHLTPRTVGRVTPEELAAYQADADAYMAEQGWSRSARLPLV